MCSLALLSILVASASAHGYVQGIVAGGVYYSGYLPNFHYRNPVPIVVGWSDPDNIENGYISPSSYSDPDIACHLSATPGGLAAKVSAGSTVELQWNKWPDSHHGPILDYIAKCPEDSCKDVDKSKLRFVKIGELGLVSWDKMPGKWASDELISNNNSWSIKIPTSLSNGSYVLRHEIIALHSANSANGAQNYPQCINLDITSSGIEDLSSVGVPATELYKFDEPGIAINIYRSLSTYAIPGPTLWSGAMKAATQTVAEIESYAPLQTDTPTISGRPTAYASRTKVTSTTASPKMTTAQTGPSPYSKIAALIDALPPGVLTHTLTGTSSLSKSTTSVVDEAVWGERPEKDLPEGWTLRDLLGWVQYVMKQAWDGNDVPGHARKRRSSHAREFFGGGRV